VRGRGRDHEYSPPKFVTGLKLPSEIPELTLSCLNVRSLPNKTDDVLEVIRDRHEDVFLSHCYKTDTTLSDTDLVVDLAVAFAA